MTDLQNKAIDLQAWLADLDLLPLECDGMSRCISMLLSRDSIPHRVMIGKAGVVGLGLIQSHYWVDLDNNYIIDMRARMWLGDDVRVPHGVFECKETHLYSWLDAADMSRMTPLVFEVLTGIAFDAYPRIKGCRE